MAKTGRKEGYKLPPSRARFVTDQIEVSKLVTLLTKHAEGNHELSPTQVQACKILLDKSLSNAPTRSEVSGPDGGEIPVGIKVSFV